VVAAPFSSYEQDPYAQFLVPPADDLEEPLRGYLGDTGRFQAVTESGSALKPNLLVEVSVRQLYGDFRKKRAPAAVLEMSFSFFQATSELSGAMISQKSYIQTIPIAARTAAALMAGWNEALKRITSTAADFEVGESNRLTAKTRTTP
jgi:ABC-type uncharacterized transport system auxiliary subunit